MKNTVYTAHYEKKEKCLEVARESLLSHRARLSQGNTTGIVKGVESFLSVNTHRQTLAGSI